MKKFHLLILMIATTGLLASCSFVNRTAKMNYDNKSNSVTSGKIVKRKYQKGFYVDLFKSKIPQKIITSHDNTINPPVVVKAISKHAEDNNQTNYVSQTPDGNSNLLASNDNVIVNSKDQSGLYTIIPIVVNKPVKSFEIIKYKRNKYSEQKNKNKSSDDNKISGLAVAGFLLALSGIGILFLPVSQSVLMVISIISMMLCVLAIILSIIGKHKMSTSHNEIKGKGFAIFGIILGWIGLGVAALVCLLISTGSI